MKKDLAATSQDLGRVLAYLRSSRTQAQIARECGLTRSTWSLYEAGRRRPSAASLAKILSVLKTSPQELEELAWNFRRRRLSAENGGLASKLRRPNPKLREEPFPRQGHTGPTSGRVVDPELAAILARLSSALEELVISVLRRTS